MMVLRRLLLCLWLTLLAAAAAPSHSVTSFSELPARLFFFDDSEAVLYHNAQDGSIWVSQDQGKEWKLADGIPKGEQILMLFEHPFNNRFAFAMARGKRHYRTDDHGKSWHSFEMPSELALVPQPLSFHSDPKKTGLILYQGTKCERRGWSQVCVDQTYYTKEAFSDDPKVLLSDTTRCLFAHSSKDFKHEAPENLVYCVAFDSSSTSDSRSFESSRLFSSTDFFEKDNRVEELGIGKNARGVLAFAIVSKYAVVALKDLSPSNRGEMLLYVTVDTKTWAKAEFPHATSAKLRENAYTIVESTSHSLAVDVVLHEQGNIGTLFVSNSNGTYFVQSLQDTNRNEVGFVDFEKVYGLDGVGIANVVANAEAVEGIGAKKALRSVMTFNDGRTWAPLRAPKEDISGRKTHCDTDDPNKCSLHLHSVTTPHNYGRIFSSPAPGLVMGVGSIGATLLPYDESDLFLSTDAGVSWRQVKFNAHKYEFGDLGSVLVVVNDEEAVDQISYSLDFGASWHVYDIGVKMRAKGLVTVRDSTTQKFILLGQVLRRDHKDGLGKAVIVQLDFNGINGRKCGPSDFDQWYARPHGEECLMGHKQWYQRRKPEAKCYVGEKFQDPVEHMENCECKDADYECDFNYVKSGDKCMAMGPEPIPAGICANKKTYLGSSGWRKIPGNTCTGGNKDAKIEKPCSEAKPEEGSIIHQTFEFPRPIRQHAYFKQSKTILVLLQDNSIWISQNEGYIWEQLFKEHNFVAFYHHPYSSDRAYLLTDTARFFTTTDSGKSWIEWAAPTPPNTFGLRVLRFSPETERILWLGNKDCTNGRGRNCHVEAQFSRNHGRTWTFVENYVKNCGWARDSKVDADPTEIICESYKTKNGPQELNESELQLVEGTQFFQKKKTLFNNVVGFAKFSEYLIVAEMLKGSRSLELQVSLDGFNFAAGQFPPAMHPETHAYTILESSTKSLFVHMTMSEKPYWGTILKSNSNGTYFGVSIENVNRNDHGYVDFEKMIGIDGIALVNVVANPDQAKLTGNKAIQTRITHNDGGSWRTLTPPKRDSQGNEYKCTSTKCALHIHGYTERRDSRATYSSPSVVGLLMAVGNVGEVLAPYKESDTFLSRDGGFTWEEVHKDAHLWEFGDSGSVLVMVNDEVPTDHLLFSTDEGLKWRDYKFSNDAIRVYSIVTVPSDTSRRFILLGENPRTMATVSIHVDFSALTNKRCILNLSDPGHDDFELWSPGDEREEMCLFGRQTLYHRRAREAFCVVGELTRPETKVQKNCACTDKDFECEFNHVRDANGNCVLVSGTFPRASEANCGDNDEYWYERTAYRKIPYSSCEGGKRPDHGAAHACPGIKGHGFWWWLFVLILPVGFAALMGYSFYRKSGMAQGTIRLPGDGRGLLAGRQGDILDTLASIPWFLVGVAAVAWEWTLSKIDSSGYGRSRTGYRNLSVDEDAQVLRFEDED